VLAYMMLNVMIVNEHVLSVNKTTGKHSKLSVTAYTQQMTCSVDGESAPLSVLLFCHSLRLC